jgi:hypothetical protein
VGPVAWVARNVATTTAEKKIRGEMAERREVFEDGLTISGSP